MKESSSSSLLDLRLEIYFWLTTFNSLLDIVFQDETTLLTVLFLAKVATTYWMVQHHPASRYAMATCLLATVSYWFFFRSPAIWDSTMWSMQTDTVVALWLLLYAPTTRNQEEDHDDDDTTFFSSSSPQQLGNTVTQMFCWYYAAAGFFKINSHFFDPNASCATVFFVQHVTYYLGNILSYETIVKLCSMVKPWAPILTLGIELSMAGGLILGQVLASRQLTRLGLLLILYFHLAVCLTPKPLDISMFAYQCASRLVMALNVESLRYALKVVRPYRTPLILLAIAWTIYGAKVNFTPLNWAFAAYVPVLVLHTLAIRREGSTQSVIVPVSRPTTPKPLWSYLAIFVAFFYSFGTIILGLQEEGTCNMFANLKIHGGSNHYLLPTGLLLSGPEIRIQQSTSWWFTTTYPADLSHTVEPSMASSVLKDIGNPAPFLFNGGANRVLELFPKGYVKHNGVFVPYTVPTLEFQRLFGEAIVHDGNFTLEYVELPGKSGNEQWRATASERTINVQVQNGAVTRCKANGRPCTEKDWVYRYDEISWWRRKFSMYHGYPIVFNADGTVRESITCFGP